MKKPKDHSKKTSSIAPVAVHGTEPGNMDIAPEQSQENPKGCPVEIAEKDQFRHHATEESRVFRKGDPIPEGWTKHPIAKSE